MKKDMDHTDKVIAVHNLILAIVNDTSVIKEEIIGELENLKEEIEDYIDELNEDLKAEKGEPMRD
jgi:hypothetical protein